MSYLRINVIHFFPLQNCGNPVDSAIVKPGKQNGIQTIQMSREIPEASFPTESSVDQHVEPVDPEQSRISLAPFKKTNPN